MRAVLVLGGDPPTDAELQRVQDGDIVVATDGGAGALLHRGVFPHRIIGDMDSITAADRQLAVANGVPLDVHPAAKAETDGELALAYLLEQGPDEILMMGGHGGRAAMFLTHMRLLRTAAEAGVRATMVGHNEAVTVLLAGTSATIERPGVLDLVAMEPAVVDLQGTTYDGSHALAPWTGQGVSNPILQRGARIDVRAGTVVVILEGPGDGPAFRMAV